jgi:hypothetical protein
MPLLNGLAYNKSTALVCYLLIGRLVNGSMYKPSKVNGSFKSMAMQVKGIERQGKYRARQE